MLVSMYKLQLLGQRGRYLSKPQTPNAKHKKQSLATAKWDPHAKKQPPANAKWRSRRKSTTCYCKVGLKRKNQPPAIAERDLNAKKAKHAKHPKLHAKKQKTQKHRPNRRTTAPAESRCTHDLLPSSFIHRTLQVAPTTCHRTTTPATPSQCRPQRVRRSLPGGIAHRVDSATRSSATRKRPTR